MKLKTGILAAVALAAVPFANAGDLLIRGGVHNVDPNSSNDFGLPFAIDVSSNATLSVGATWFVTKNIAVDLLGALPFKHDIKAAGTTVATVKHLPPTLDVQYHFNPGGAFDPYLGAGVNVTLFFSENINATGQAALSSLLETTVGPNDLNVKTTIGPAVQAGADIAVGKDWVIGVDVRWAQIEPKVELLGAELGKLKLDPLVYGITIGRRFSL